LVVAESERVAQDAAEQVTLDCEDLAATVDAANALRGDAIPLHEEFSDNLVLDYEYGDEQTTTRLFKSAAHVASIKVTAQRIAGNPMEPKSCVALYHDAKDSFEICIPTQGAADLRTALSQITGLPQDRFRIHSSDVGGGFGVRHEVYPEYLAIMAAAKKSAPAGEMGPERGLRRFPGIITGGQRT
jgi:carbon-monoxide dehydrogenase large subunit